MLSYCFILSCNIVIILTIVLENHLHEPMYLLLINLPINDLMGDTAFFPQFLKEIILDAKSIRYPACKIILVWMVDFIMIVVLFSLVLRFPRCRSLISNPYCDNPSLIRLVCADTSINNIYGLFITAFLQVLSIGTVIHMYLQILLTCLKNKQSDTKSKAMQTCATHLVVFIVLEITGFITIVSYRFETFSTYSRKIIAVFVIMFPSTLNPIIYGLKTKEIRRRIPLVFRRRVTPF
ncbi:olfactory receptor 52K2-like [Amia ocellicauda]|uniref:olfactory receptor 52K2-like n=1 Tax=Amia ocellicauda TaxID=2972642 RepID=UPI003463B6DF